MWNASPGLIRNLFLDVEEGLVLYLLSGDSVDRVRWLPSRSDYSEDIVLRSRELNRVQLIPHRGRTRAEYIVHKP